MLGSHRLAPHARQCVRRSFSEPLNTPQSSQYHPISRAMVLCSISRILRLRRGAVILPPISPLSAFR